MTTNPEAKRLLTRASLASAILMPIFYFAAQFTAAPFYPGYSFVNQFASDLGASGSQHPWLFNLGIALTGIAAIAASYGLYKAFRACNGVVVSRMIAFSVAYTGFASIKAAIFPLPDHRHGTPGIIFTLMIPVLMFIAAWRGSLPGALRIYLLFSALLLAPVLFQRYEPDTLSWIGKGTMQRLLALATYVPIGAVGVFFFYRDAEQSLTPQAADRRS